MHRWKDCEFVQTEGPREHSGIDTKLGNSARFRGAVEEKRQNAGTRREYAARFGVFARVAFDSKAGNDGSHLGFVRGDRRSGRHD